MPEIAAFRALRYAPAAGATSDLICPPYDVIGPAEREALAARSPHNYVRLELPVETGGEGKYAVAARTLREWIEKKILARDETPALYVLEQTFTALGETRTRRGILALLRLHDFSEGVVLPHERTLSGPKADRMELMKTTAANTSPIFSLFPDEKNEVWSLLAPRIEGAAPVAEAETDHVRLRMWRVDDKKTVEAVKKALADRRAYIADGHHRYETALGYKKALDEQAGKSRPRGAHSYIISFLCSMNDPGLVVLPTHRMLVGLPNFKTDLFLKLVDEFFVAEDAGDLAGAGLQPALDRLRDLGREGHALLLVAQGSTQGRFLRKRDTADTTHVHALPKNPTLRALDVSILHGLILEHTLGLSPESQARQENLRYVKDAREAVAKAASGEAQLVFIMNPTPMWQVRAVAEAGEVMPQKSTFFYPKIPSGLALRQIDPGEDVA